MKKEEMTKVVNIELKELIPIDLSEEAKKMWRFAFNIHRRKDLAQTGPHGGEAIAADCLNYIRENNPELLR